MGETEYHFQFRRRNPVPDEASRRREPAKAIEIDFQNQ
jgi:hypothetical protein